MHSLMRICDTDIRVKGRLLRVARLEADGYQFLENPSSLLEDLKRTRTGIDLFTFTQRLPETAPKYPYPMEWHNFAAIQITTFEQWWNSQIGFKARNKAKQAEKKGVVVREVPFDANLVKGIWEVYNECPVRQGRPFSHYGKDIETVHREEATFLDSSVFIGAFLEDHLIGFAKLVADETRTQAGLMNIVSMIGQRDKAPTNALVAQAVRSCAERSIPYLVYSSYSYGKRRSDSVTDFKERNAFQRINVPRYYVPLTAVGRAAFQLGLHKGVVDHVPEPILSKVRLIRNAWYNRGFKSDTKA